MNKKILGALLTFALATSAAGLTACKKGGDESSSKQIVLENFTDTQVEVTLGSTYSLASPVAYDQDGNEYRVVYSAATASGSSVSISNNRIAIDVFEDYKITCTVDADGEIFTRTLTLNVKDKDVPIVTVGSTSIGFIGKEYTLPSIEVKDASQEKITPTLKLYHVNGETETEVTVTNGKFTPTLRGLYRLDVTAKDSSGNEGKASAEFTVRSLMKPFVIEDFDDEYGKAVYANKACGMTEEDEVWHETFEGKTGVVSAKSTTNDYGPHQYFKFNMTTEELAAIDFEYIYFDVYIAYDSTKGDKTNANIYTKNTPLGTFEFNKWVQIRLTPEQIADKDSFFTSSDQILPGETARDCFNRVMTTGKGGCPFYAFDDSGKLDAYTFYVAEIGYKGIFRPTTNLKEKYTLGEYVTLNMTVDKLTDYTLGYEVTAPSGTAVTLDSTNKFRLTESGEYTVKVTVNHAAQGGEFTYKIVSEADASKKFTIGEFTGKAKQGEEVTVPTATFGSQTVTAVAKIGNYTQEIVGGKFTPKLYGEYTIEYSATESGLVYRDSSLKIPVEKTVKANEINSFDGADSVDTVTLVSNATSKKAEWLAEFEGEQGVVKISETGSAWPAFTFFPVQKMSAYEDYDYLMFKIFLPSDALTYNGFNFINADGGEAQYRENLEKGKWIDVQFDIAGFKKYWKDNRDEMDLSPARIFSGETPRTEVVVYIADISAVKNASKANLTVTVSENPTLEQEVTLNVVNPDSLTYTFKLFDPTGAEVTLTNHKFTPAAVGEYTYRFTAEGFVGEKTGSFEVKHDTSKRFTIGEFTGTPKQGDEITIPEATFGTAGVTITATAKMGAYTVNIVNGKFTANFFGEYTIEYAAELDGQIYSDTSLKISVARETSANEVESFNGNTSLNSILPNGGTNSKEWLAEFEGETGVAKITYTGTKWPELNFFPIQQMSAYADYDYLVFKVYLSETYPAFNFIANGKVQYRNPEKGKWVEVQVDIAAFLASWKDNHEEMNLRDALIGTDAPAKESDTLICYISEIYVTKNASKANAALSGGETPTVGNEVTLSVTGTDAANCTAFKLFDPNGDEVALTDNKFTPLMPGEYTYKMTLSGFVGEKTGSFEIKADESKKFTIGEFTGTPKQGDEITIPEATFGTAGVTVTATAKMGTYTVNIVNGKFTANFFGEYTIEYAAELDGQTYRDTSLKITVARETSANEVESFNGNTSVNSVTVVSNATDKKVEWLPEYEGETGVVKISETGSAWPAFTFFPVQQMSAYEDYDYLVFKIFLPSDALTYNGFHFINNDEAQYCNNLEKGKWIDVRFDISGFKKYWKDNHDEMDLSPARIFSGETPRTEVVIYISEIYVAKNISKADLTVTVSEKPTFEQEVTLSVGNPDSLTYTFKLFDPNGDEVTLTDNKFTPSIAGVYTYKMTAEGFVGEKTGTFEVKYDTSKQFTIGEFTGTPKQGDEITIPEATFGTAGVTVTATAKMGAYTVNIVNGKFTANFFGEYTIEYAAELDGQIYSDTSLKIAVARETSANEVESFNGNTSLNSILPNGGTNSKEWLAEFEGETGVAKITYTGTEWPELNFFPVQQMSAYADYDYLVFKVYLSETYPAFNFIANGKVQYRNPEKGKWVEVQVDIAAFLASWKDNHEEMNLRDALIGTDAPANAADTLICYISEIYVTKNASKANAALSGGENPTVGNEVTLSVTGTDAANCTAFKLFDPNGDEVALTDNKFTPLMPGEYTYKMTLSGYDGEKTGSFEIKADESKKFSIGEFTGAPKQGEEITIPEATFGTAGVTVTATAKMGTYTVNVVNGKFTANFFGEYTIEYAAELDGQIYSDTSLKITVARTTGADEVESFNGNTSVSSVTIFNGSDHKVEWLPEYEGETGVVRLSGNGTEWPAFTFFPVQEMSKYAGSAKLVFRVYLPETGTTYNGFNLINKDGEVQWGNPAKGNWVNVEFNAEAFLQYWKDDRTQMNTSVARAFSNQTPSTEVVLYLADIRVIRSVQSTRLAVETEGTLVIGNEVTLNVSNPDSLTYTLKLFDPTGEEVTLTDGAFTAEMSGTYTYKITAEGYVGEATGEIAVLAALDIEIGEVTGTFKKGDVVTLPGTTVYDNGSTVQATVECTVKYGETEIAVTEGKFEALYAGVYTVTYAAEYNGARATKSVQITVLETDYLVKFDHAEKLSQIYTQMESTKEFIDAAAIAASEGALPALPDGESGYVKLTGKANSYGTFAFGVKNDFFTTQMLKENDYIDVTLYFAGEKNLRIFWFNHRLNETTPTAEKGKWVTVRMPIGLFSQTEHTNRQFTTVEQFANTIATEKLFDLYDWSTTADEVCYIASVKLVKAEADTTLGDKFVNLTKDTWQNVVQTKGDVLSWDDTENALKIEARAGSWENLYFVAGKNFSELHEYSKIRFAFKDFGSGFGMFVQNNLWGTGNVHLYYQVVAGEDGITYLEMSMENFLKYYYCTSRGADATFSDAQRALLISNGSACTCYLKDIVLVK